MDSKLNTNDIFSSRQIQFIIDSNAKWNLAYGAVRSGKTECTLFRFLQAAFLCPDSQIFMIGYTSDSIYQNVIRLIFECPRFTIFKPFCTWHSSTVDRYLKFAGKKIKILGASNEGAIGQIQGKTFSLVYCDEMTLYPKSIVDMIDTRLSMPYSQGFASMNPSYPSHVLKQWIDWANEGDKQYYALHFSIDDNPFLPDDYKKRLQKSLVGLFYKRYYLGLWVLADGSIFDFFDKDIYVVKKPPRAANYWIAGIDYGASNPTTCILIGVNTGVESQRGKMMWVEKEYYWNPKEKRDKTIKEYAEDICEFLHDYSLKGIYMDPSAHSFEIELKRMGLPIIHAENEVLDGIYKLTSEMKAGNLFILDSCVNTIKEIESYCWDSKESEKGNDKPIKKNDHCIDALRYSIFSHHVSEYQPYKDVERQKQYLQRRFG